jgi:hypothetical protein
MTMENIFCTVSEKSVFYQDNALGLKHPFSVCKKYFGNTDFPCNKKNFTKYYAIQSTYTTFVLFLTYY